LSRVIADRYNAGGIAESSSGSIMFGDGGSSGEWSCTDDVNGNLGDGSWTAGETITSECYYELDNAYIDRKTGEISYGSGNSDDYLSRGQLYYIPLDFPTGNFGVYGEFYDLGVQGMDSTFNWSASYECFINAQNRWDCVGEDCPGVIDCEIPEYAAAHPDICGGGDDDGSGDDCKNPEYREEHPIECENSCSNPEYYYANRDLCDAVGPGYSDNSFGFIYRPIDLYDPFPLRNPGSNWYYWYKGPNASANKHRLENTYNLTENSARLNYSVHLDAAHLTRIKEYNDQVETYLDDSINNDGTSDFFKVEKSGVPLEPKTNGIQGGNCPLGEFNESCGSGR